MPPLGAEAAFEAVIALVAQPGVEFDDRNVVVYEPERARELSAALDEMPGLVFEAHSTDYQPQRGPHRARAAMALPSLKVGPGLTFALREALYGLDQIAAAFDPGWRDHSLMAAMEREMLANPGYWQSHYRGDPTGPACPPPFQLQRPYPLLLGVPGATRSGPKALGPPDRNQCPGAPDQSIPPDALSTRGQRSISIRLPGTWCSKPSAMCFVSTRWLAAQRRPAGTFSGSGDGPR